MLTYPDKNRFHQIRARFEGAQAQSAADMQFLKGKTKMLSPPARDGVENQPLLSGGEDGQRPRTFSSSLASKARDLKATMTRKSSSTKTMAINSTNVSQVSVAGPLNDSANSLVDVFSAISPTVSNDEAPHPAVRARPYRPTTASLVLPPQEYNSRYPAVTEDNAPLPSPVRVTVNETDNVVLRSAPTTTDRHMTRQPTRQQSFIPVAANSNRTPFIGSGTPSLSGDTGSEDGRGPEPVSQAADLAGNRMQPRVPLIPTQSTWTFATPIPSSPRRIKDATGLERPGTPEVHIIQVNPASLTKPAIVHLSPRRAMRHEPPTQASDAPPPRSILRNSARDQNLDNNRPGQGQLGASAIPGPSAGTLAPRQHASATHSETMPNLRSTRQTINDQSAGIENLRLVSAQRPFSPTPPEDEPEVSNGPKPGFVEEDKGSKVSFLEGVDTKFLKEVYGSKDPEYWHGRMSAIRDELVTKGRPGGDNLDTWKQAIDILKNQECKDQEARESFQYGINVWARDHAPDKESDRYDCFVRPVDRKWAALSSPSPEPPQTAIKKSKSFTKWLKGVESRKSSRESETTPTPGMAQDEAHKAEGRFRGMMRRLSSYNLRKQSEG